jgi:hypothetical protein
MDDKTKTVMLTIATGVIKKGLIVAGTGLASHGVISSSQTEMFVAAGMGLVGLGWSFWNDYGKAIVLSQLDVLKAKSLAQAAKLQQNSIPPVTTRDIANQSPTLTPTEVAKTVATLPVEIQANVKTVALLALLILGTMAFPGDASAQVKLKPLTGNLGNDLGITKPAGQAGAGAIGGILNALDEKLLPDLQYAKKLADASGSRVTAPCYQAWIDIITTRQKAVVGADGTALDLPDPRLITDFEKAVELRNALQPDSPFMIACSPVASMVKKDIVGFIGIVISGGAGLATLVPGL